MFRILIIILFYCLPLKADQYDHRLNKLFDQLLETNDEDIINQITINIWDIWYETNDPTITRDFFRGVGLMNNGNIKVSIDYFTRVIEKNPNFAEGWNKRATAYYLLGDFDKSMIDINETLKLEPRHFGALDGMALIFIQQEKYENALEIYDEIIEIFPNSKATLQKKEYILNLITKSA